MNEPCTVVSILPYELNEIKPQLRYGTGKESGAGVFLIPAVPKGECRTLTIEYAERPFYVDYQRGNIWLSEQPEVVANAVVEDHVRATVNVTEGARPGLFYVQGLKQPDEVKKNNATALARAVREQDAWFARLVKAADDVWQKYRRHNTISDQHRLASKYLGLKREWAEEMKAENTIQCAYCVSLISTKAILCPVCRMPQEDAIQALDPKVREIISKTLPGRVQVGG